ncbi:MBL fold metallo-hydrolase [Desulfovirgula thermocuniculi]|uniref:MBL fold metallo-hydrolase n=1 Tax=Desulfovirgula thermocuniculi TaxID=348842 RepID=UPI000412D321|nr:MBL fold metallo-hydrolase [Desulfovirgula thermocuniculi]
MSRETGPGWRRLSALQPDHSLFARCLYLEGYDFSSNIYALCGDYLTLIDAGNDYTAFIQLFAEGFKPADVQKVVLTHGHMDHAMGTVELLRAYPSILREGRLEVVLHREGPEELKEIVRECGLHLREVEGGETLELSGFTFEVLATPGHTADGICLYHAESATLITGDMVLPYGIVAPDPGAGGNLRDYLSSLRQLLSLKVENLLPGHWEPVFGHARQVIRDTYEGLIKRAAGKDAPWAELALEMLRRGHLEEVVYCCERRLGENPQDTSFLGLKATCLCDLGRFREAAEAFEAVLGGDPGNFLALVGKGRALMGLGDYEGSLECFERALEKRPGSLEALVYKGLALSLAGRHEEAMAIGPFREEFARRFAENVLEGRGAV